MTPRYKDEEGDFLDDSEAPIGPALANPFDNDTDPMSEIGVRPLDDIYLIGD